MRGFRNGFFLPSNSGFVSLSFTLKQCLRRETNPLLHLEETNGYTSTVSPLMDLKLSELQSRHSGMVLRTPRPSLTLLEPAPCQAGSWGSTQTPAFTFLLNGAFSPPTDTKFCVIFLTLHKQEAVAKI